MTKCLLKALKAVNLQSYAEVFRLLGYDSAGALAHFHPDHLKQLHLTEQELPRFHALLDVLKAATREGKICPHYCKSSRESRPAAKTESQRATWTNEAVKYRNAPTTKQSYAFSKKQSQDELKPRRSQSTIGIPGRSSSTSVVTRKQHADGILLKRASSVTLHQQKPNEQKFFGPKAIANRPSVEHVKVSDQR